MRMNIQDIGSLDGIVNMMRSVERRLQELDGQNLFESLRAKEHELLLYALDELKTCHRGMVTTLYDQHTRMLKKLNKAN